MAVLSFCVWVILNTTKGFGIGVKSHHENAYANWRTGMESRILTKNWEIGSAIESSMQIISIKSTPEGRKGGQK